MKKLFNLCGILFFLNLPIYAQKTVKVYEPVYLLNTETARRVAMEQQLKQKSVPVQILLIDYPILDSLKNYNPKEKYSLINDKLISAIATTEKYTLYYLKNDQIYKVKKKKRTNVAL
jgi:hypothetical protein